MILRLNRHSLLDDRTLGSLTVFSEQDEIMFRCVTLEDAFREGEKVFGKTAIPAGHYRVVLDKSRKYGKIMPHILDVPGFKGVRIHSGNKPEDTDGCVLVGLLFDADHNIKGGTSRPAYKTLMVHLETAERQKDSVWIDITNPPARALRRTE